MDVIQWLPGCVDYRYPAEDNEELDYSLADLDYSLAELAHVAALGSKHPPGI